MADITSIAPYEAVTVNDTTDETRTDLPALIQRMENQIALQNQVIRQFLEHWDSISRAVSTDSPESIAIRWTTHDNAWGIMIYVGGIAKVFIPENMV